MKNRIILSLLPLLFLFSGCETTQTHETVDSGKAYVNNPVEFVPQVLEPTGGEMLRPRGWYYSEGHRANTWMWTVSKEDPEGGYDTGVRVQFFLNVNKLSGQTPEEFMEQTFMQKKISAIRVHSACEPTLEGLFWRSCLEVDEGEYRISYSLYWNNEIDSMCIITSGALQDEWDLYEDTFNRMNKVKLIDMDRFQNQQ